MTRDEIRALVDLWIRERALPPAHPEALAQVLVDALADHWDQTPQDLQHAVLAVVAALRSEPLRASGGIEVWCRRNH